MIFNKILFKTNLEFKGENLNLEKEVVGVLSIILLMLIS